MSPNSENKLEPRGSGEESVDLPGRVEHARGEMRIKSRLGDEIVGPPNAVLAAYAMRLMTRVLLTLAALLAGGSLKGFFSGWL